MSNKISTKWASKVKPDNPLPEYPRPQMVRDSWLSLNGRWDYKICSSKGEISAGEIIVPFAVETSLSGVEKSLLPNEQLIYKRKFNIPNGWKGKRLILNFEAVDYKCDCYINGVDAGSHIGGYLPFSFDITDIVEQSKNRQEAVHELKLIVTDPSDAGLQQRGKQVLRPGRINYTATSGIWQSVWLEAVPLQNHITNLTVTPDLDHGSVMFNVDASAEGEVSIIIKHGGRSVAEAAGRCGHEITAVVVTPELWTPANPRLYDAVIYLHGENEKNDEKKYIEKVETYFAFRKIEIRTGINGKKWIYLNGEAIFLHAPLDQGYWPESGMTPPSDEAMIFDIEKTKELGFNCTRKHIKIELRRWYYHADRLGILVMQDMISGGRNAVSQMWINILIALDGRHRKDTGNNALERAGRRDVSNRQEYEAELKAMIQHLWNHPSIIMWIPFNEAWGQFESTRIFEIVKTLDSTRLIDPVSGWLDQGDGEFRSRHTYSVKLKTPPVKDERIYFISEYGGYNLLIAGHLWDETKKFGYKNETSRTSLCDSYTNLIRKQLIPLIKSGLGAAVYTQLTDVEIESNGFYTYDRKILKIDHNIIAGLNEEIYAEFRHLVEGSA